MRIAAGLVTKNTSGFDAQCTVMLSVLHTCRNCLLCRWLAAGVAEDYCVMFTVGDALELDYTVHLIREATRAVEPRRAAEIEVELVLEGVRVVTDWRAVCEQAPADQ